MSDEPTGSAPRAWRVASDEAAVRTYFDRLDLPVRALARRLDELVREVVPDVRAGIKWSVPFYARRGPVCYVSAAKRHVTFGLAQGARVHDATGILTGTGRSPIRKAILRVDEEMPEAALRAWLRAAAKADEGWGRD